MLIEGINSVLEALDGGATIEKICLLKGNTAGRSGAVFAKARAAGIKTVFVEKEYLDKMSVSHRHQGVIAVATEYEYFDLEDTLAQARREGGKLFFVLLDGVEDPHNLGAVIRVADCAGVTAVVIPRHRSVGVTDTVIRVSAGATAHVKICKVANLNDAVRSLKNEGVTVLAADMDGDSVYNADLTGNTAIVVGGEGGGIHALTRKLCDGVVSIPQFGKVNSLNASVACGILLYEAVRQRISERHP